MWVFACLFVWLSLGSKALKQSHLLSASRAKQAFPCLKSDGLCGAMVYYDGQMDDARLNLAVIQTAACYGAVVLNYVELERLAIDEETGLVRGHCRRWRWLFFSFLTQLVEWVCIFVRGGGGGGGGGWGGEWGGGGGGGGGGEIRPTEALSRTS